MAGFDGELQLGADAVIGGDQHRVLVAAGLEIEKTAEAAKAESAPLRRVDLRQRLDLIDQLIAGGDVDAGVGVGHTVLPAACLLLPMPLVCPNSKVDMPLQGVHSLKRLQNKACRLIPAEMWKPGTAD